MPGPDDLEALTAVLQRLGPRAVLSGPTAAAVHGLPLVEAPGRHVTVPQSHSRAAAPGWQLRRRDLPAGDVEERHGLRCTTVLRTLLDLTAVLPTAEAVATLDAAVHGCLVDEAELLRLLLSQRGRGCHRPRRAAGLLDGRAESVLESLLRVLLALGGLPAPEVQAVLLDERGQFVARVDLCWRPWQLVVEADGFAFHSDRAAYRRDRERLNALERLGWRVLRFTWEDVRSRPEHVLDLVRDCLRAAA